MVLRSGDEGPRSPIYAICMSVVAPARPRGLRFRWPNPSRVDVAIAGAVAAAQVGFTSLAAGHQTGRAAMDAGAYLLLAGSGISLLARRAYPREVLALTLAFTLAYWSLDYPRGPIFIALIVAFVTVIVQGRRVFGWTALVVGYVAFAALGELTGTENLSLGAEVATGAWLLALGAGAELLRARSERATEARRTREQESLRRVGEERLRIARELHDVLAHNVSLINVQAGVALHLLDEHPEQAEPALAAIKQASAETLREMRSVLGTLRQVDERAPRSPAPTLGALDRLVARLGAAGLEVTVKVEGDQRPLRQPVDPAAYRVVQEALTNVARHSGATAAEVRLRYGEDDLLIEVLNDDRGPVGRPFVEGNGIVGMRERVVGLGGEFAAGRDNGGRFVVRARLPLGGRG
jgi:signal transduction histidine kinase